MSEPFAERLSRFTPDGGGLDRDALLFAAGRASARPGRPWMALAGALAASQLLTLLCLWPRTPPAAPSAVAPTPPIAVEPPAPADAGSWAAAWRLRNEPDALPPPAAVDSLVPDDPPLRAGAVSSALLN